MMTSPARPASRTHSFQPHAGQRAVALALAAGLALPPAFARQPEAQPVEGGMVVNPSSAQPGQPTPPGVPPQPGQPATPGQPGQPAAGATDASKLPDISVGEDEVLFSVLSEPVELTALVALVARTLNINVTIDAGLQGTISFNAPVKVKKDRLIPMLAALLEQRDFSITFIPETGMYMVHPSNKVPPQLDGDTPTTEVIPTPNVRPSALKPAIESQFGSGGGAGAGGAPGMPQPPQMPGQGVVGSSLGQVAYIDELGVIVATGSQRKLNAIKSLVRLLLEQYNKSTYTRHELRFVAASVARERAIQLIGQAPQPTNNQNNFNRFGGFNQGGDGQQQPQQRPTTLDNLADRLTIDPQGNALFFRGLPEETARVKEVIRLIDVPTGLSSREYMVGSGARSIADLAKQRGLGDVNVINSSEQQNQNRVFFFDPFQQQQQRQPVTVGGPVMVVDERRGSILYYATDEQQQQLAELVKAVQFEDEIVVVREYKLKHAKAADVAELILGLLQNRTPRGDGDTLPSDSNSNSNNNVFNPFFGFDPSQLQSRTGDGVGFVNDDNTFVIADEQNNQVLVKARAQLQVQFEQLIQRLDQRRGQVYLECKIIAVSATDDFRLAFETQLINANGTGGVINTDFNLSSFAAGANLNQRKTVNTNLGGLTSAIIKSDQIPIIINALQTVTDTRILSSPTLVVDDNVEAEINSVNEQPTTTTTQGTATTESNFGGYEKAGTNLKITPQIAEGGYVKLAYTAELSNFEGSTANGVPPPRNTNTATAESVSVPSDMTVVVGGLTLDSTTDTVAKVPFLGDIPLIGLLFRDTQKVSRKTTLYIFLTPRILTDPTFLDYKILTEGPARASNIDTGLPPQKPAVVRVFNPNVSAPTVANPLPSLAPADAPAAPPLPTPPNNVPPTSAPPANAPSLAPQPAPAKSQPDSSTSSPAGGAEPPAPASANPDPSPTPPSDRPTGPVARASR